MTTAEIFTSLILHMNNGIRMHYEMMKECDFLSLEGYRRMQEYHYYSELKGKIDLYHYYMIHYNKLLEEALAAESELISSSWYKYIRQEVDTNTRRSTIKNMMKQWIEWEQETKIFYQKKYKELIELDEVAAASFLENYINDVSEELQQAQQKAIELETINYDIVEIVDEQLRYLQNYEKRIKKLYKER